MLKTWKEPVPGSVDTRPIFQPEVTRPIENALIKARTSAIQANQQNARSQHLSRAAPGTANALYRNSPTPPTTQRPAQYPSQGYPSPQAAPLSNQYSSQQQIGQQNFQPPYAAQQVRTSNVPPANLSDYWTPQAVPRYQTPPIGTGSWQQPAPQGQGYRVPDDSIDTLNSDIASLINSAKFEFAQNPYDGSIQKRLKALLDLQSILTSQKLPQDQLALIREQVKVLSAPSRPPPPTQPVQAPVNVSQPLAQPPSLASLLGGPGALAALLSKAQNGAQAAAPNAPPPPVAQPQFAPPPHPAVAPAPKAATPVPQAATSLLDQLRAAGLLGAGSNAISAPHQMPQFPPQLPLPSGPFPGGFPPPPMLNTQSQFPGAPWPGAASLNDVQLNPASLKM